MKAVQNDQQSAEFWIEKLGLQPHPEGGFFRETYRSEELISAIHLPERYKDGRSFGTAIFFLLKEDQFSAFHRLQSDEIWHLYTGSSLSIFSIAPEGNLERLRLGSEYENGERFQIVIPRGNWFAARVDDSKSYSLVGCTVAPGFDFADFEMGERQALVKSYPKHKAIITDLTHG